MNTAETTEDRVRWALRHVSDNGLGDMEAAVIEASDLIDTAVAQGRRLAALARFHGMHAEVSEKDRAEIDQLCSWFEVY